MEALVGYENVTIDKRMLSEEQLKKIKKDLKVTPVINFGNVVPRPITVFLETKSEICVPIYYFLENFKEFNLTSDFQENNIVFPKDLITLRPNQRDCFEECVKQKEKEFGGGIIQSSTAFGKCVGYDTEVLLYNGKYKKVQDISVGELLMGDDSEPRKVMNIVWGQEQMYSIHYNGTFFTCNGSHILSLKNEVRILEIESPKYPYVVKYFCSVNLKNIIKFVPSLRDALGVKKFIEKMTGFLEITVEDYIDSECKLQMYYRQEVTHWQIGKLSDDQYYSIGTYTVQRDICLMKEDLTVSSSQRLILLAGMIDHTKTHHECWLYHSLTLKSSKNLKLVEFLLRSLALEYKIFEGNCSESKVIKITGYYSINLPVIPLKIKKIIALPKVSNSIKFDISYYDEDSRYYGFEIDGNRRFVLSDFTVTHNTVLALKLAAEFQKKTLIVVNKTELARQWRQEIEKFIPGTKIGTIQGTTFDIEGAQIVIGMLQTISIKSHLSHKNFDWVGLGIIDECHNISSEVFSRVMFKVRPKFLFGLTATLERKDKTEQMIKWYIGDTLYSDRTNSLKQQTDIHIYKYTGKSSVEKFLRDGTVAISEMLSNLAEDPERTTLIVKILKELLLDKTKNIILLADRTGILKKLLKYFPEEAGLFIGSCKPDQLLAAKEKRLLLATYAMASEGFSLEKLNCLVFATPRSSITQALGRIYRKKHSTTPVIVDIVDNFSVFKGQSFKRKKIYKESIENPCFLEKNGSNPKKDQKNGKVLVIDIFDEIEECLIED